MKWNDRKLGMERKITRRDLLQGVGVLATGALVPGSTTAEDAQKIQRVVHTGATYPPALTGMRGSHPGSFEVAHQVARAGQSDWGAVSEPDTQVYDLVVVGAGISGLAAAYFFRQQQPDARILILENHDDFGGHARRNEFKVGGKTLLGYGGSQSLEEPYGYSAVVKRLLRDLGVDLKRFKSAYNEGFYKRHGLTSSIHFDREHWGSERLVRFNLGLIASYVPLADASLSPAAAVAQMPLSGPAKKEFLRLLLTNEDQMSEIPVDAKAEYLEGISYRQFLEKHLGISEPEVFTVLQQLSSDSCVGIEATPAIEAIAYTGLPGWSAAGLPDEQDEPYIHHFPDGNASIARLLVRALIPESASGHTMEDVVTASFDYSKLDRDKAPVRLRLNSTVVGAVHQGNPYSAKRVNVTYVRAGHSYRVQARACIMACYNTMVPYLCPQLPAQQRKALAFQVKAPILYTSVALRNWRAWKNLGIGAAVAPTGYHVVSMLDFPVSLGSYQYAAGPDDPIAVHMERFMHRPNEGLSPAEQHRLARQDLLATPFENIEREIRKQLTGLLAPGGFDPVHDIEGITVNRWAHGYARWYNPLFDTVYDNDDDPRYPHMRARKRFGRIAIANSDAGASALLPAAVEQGYRAVTELA